MVKKLLLFLVYIMFFILALIYFSPKQSLYFSLEETLKSNGVILSQEKLKDKAFSLLIEDAKLSVKSIESADIKNIQVSTFGLYNSISCSDIELSKIYQSFLPLHVDSVDIVYSALNPLNVKVYSQGEFGVSESTFNLSDSTLHVELKPSDVMLRKYKQSLREYTKNEDGEFIYDQTF